MGSGYSLKKSASEPRPPFTTNLECSIQARGGVCLSGSWGSPSWGSPSNAQRPAVAPGKPALPVRCVYVRNSDIAGAPARPAPSPGSKWPRLLLKSARVCKSARTEVGKCPLATGERQKKNYPVQQPPSESKCSFQLRNRPRWYFSCPQESWCALRDNHSLWKFTSPDFTSHSLPGATRPLPRAEGLRQR